MMNTRLNKKVGLPTTIYNIKYVRLQPDMDNVVAFVQLKAFARQDGVFLALLWIAGFLTMLFLPASPFGSLLTLSTPFFVGWLLVRFRNYAYDGVISFGNAFLFSVLTFFYASLIFTAAQFVYLRYFDAGRFMTMIQNSVLEMERVYKDSGMQIDNIRQGAALIGQLSAIELALVFMVQNMLIGFILSVPIALLCKRSKK